MYDATPNPTHAQKIEQWEKWQAAIDQLDQYIKDARSAATAEEKDAAIQRYIWPEKCRRMQRLAHTIKAVKKELGL